jgi:hypothetical protein
MNDVVDYTATTASDNVTDMYDHDNFYPYDGLNDGMEDIYDEDYGYYTGLDADGEGLDIEYSEAFGDFVKKVGGLFKKGGMKGAISGRREGLDARLSAREDRIRERQSRKTRRQAARERRKNLRQIQTWQTLPTNVKEQANTVANKSAAEGNASAQESLDNLKGGEASPPQEQEAMQIIQAAQNDVASGDIGAENASTVTKNAAGQPEVNDTWWKRQGTGVKVAIIGGGVVVLGLGIWGLTRLGKK